MKPGSVDVVPSGKKPKMKKPFQFKQQYYKIRAWFRAKKIRGPYFVMATSLAVVALLILQNYMSNFVYVVLLNDSEIGVVSDAREIKSFIAELTDRCDDLYGMEIKPGDSIALIREYRPDSKPDPEVVQAAIRQHLTLLTDAYMIIVDDAPLVPVNTEEDLVVVIELLKDNYVRNGNGVRVLDAFIVEEIDLERCSVDPETVFKAEDVVSLILKSRESQPVQTALITDAGERSFSDSRQSFSFDRIVEFSGSAEKVLFDGEEIVAPSNGISVKTVEEVTLIEEIPFSVEYVYDEEMWIVQSEITIEGKEGKKELVYHIIRENGVEIDRLLINETILEQPVTQIEKLGTAKVPSVGTTNPEQSVGKVEEERVIVIPSLDGRPSNAMKIKIPASTPSNAQPPVKQAQTIPSSSAGAPSNVQQPVKQAQTQDVTRTSSIGKGQFIWPVQGGGGVTPGRGFSSWHTGIDIGASTGTNILAADSGVVWFSGWGSSQGNYLIIYHGSYWSLYLHNNANLVSKGEQVSQGQVIATVGSSGRSTGPHLHFEVRRDDGSGEWHTYYQHLPIDPLQFFKL
jgi:murein DD-endopeptidase MepM/ murein hydrolase activator NlpD